MRLHTKLISILAGALILTSCTAPPAPTTKGNTTALSDFFLNTISTITIYDMDDEEAKRLITDCFRYSKEYETILSKTIDESDVSLINNSQGEWVTVGDDTIYLIQLSQEYSILTDGAFDASIAPASDLWDFNTETPEIPNPALLAEAVSHINWENIEVDGNQVRLLDPDAAIDLGGSAKGYIGDKAKEYLVSRGVTKAIVNLGGNILTINPDTSDNFKIGIQNPFDSENPVYGVLTINNLSVVTSGIYERYFEDENLLYHHILDTSTGYPINNGLYSVTIITENSALADVLSTSCFALGLEEGLALAESVPGVEAIFITDTYAGYYTSGIGEKIKFEKR